jgi:hypothetical protein
VASNLERTTCPPDLSTVSCKRNFSVKLPLHAHEIRARKHGLVPITSDASVGVKAKGKSKSICT